MNTYQERLARDITSSLRAALDLFERQSANEFDLMARLPNVHTQAAQAAMWTSELYGSMSQDLSNSRKVFTHAAAKRVKE